MKKQNSNTEKLGDKAFVRLITMSVFGILLCIVCLCSSSYAWFSTSLSNNSNVIQSAQCLLTVVANDGDNELVQNEDGSTTITASGTYTVTVSLPEGSSSGYCVIKAGGNVYHSDYIAWDEAPAEFSFTLVVSDGYDFSGSVVLAPHWGIYSGECDIEAGGTITIE